MKSVNSLLFGFGLAGLGLLICVWIGLISLTIYGLYLAFSASILLGIVVLFVEPMPLILALAMLIAHKDVAHMIVDFFSK
jgi:hypothetical protein